MPDEPDSMDTGLQMETFRAAARSVGLEIDSDEESRLRCAALWLARLSQHSGISGYDSAQAALMRGMAPALAYFALDTPRRAVVADLVQRLG